MAKTKHWDDTSRYALRSVEGGYLVVALDSGGSGYVILDGPPADTRLAIAEFIDAGCPVLESNEHVLELALQSRGRTRWEFAGSTAIGLWQDRWRTIWLRASSGDPVSGAAHLSKFEALRLAEQLIALANASTE